MFKYRRVLAFMVDVLLVSFVSLLLIGNPKINPNYDDSLKYNEALIDKRSNISLENFNVEQDDPSEYMYNAMGQELYDATKAQGINIIIFLIVNTLYFAVFTYFNGGKTVGCALSKLKITKANGNKANILNLTMRSMFMGSSIFMYFPLLAISMLVIPRLFEIKTAFFAIIYTNSVLMLLELALFIVFMVSKKNHTIQDFISNTKIIDTKLKNVL